MMSSVMELNPTLQTVHTALATTVATMKMLESDVPVSVHVRLLASGLPLYKAYCIVGNFGKFCNFFTVHQNYPAIFIHYAHTQ